MPSKSFAEVARSVVGSQALVARIGGEEFVALLPDHDGPRAKEVGENVVRVSPGRSLTGWTAWRSRQRSALASLSPKAKRPRLPTCWQPPTRRCIVRSRWAVTGLNGRRPRHVRRPPVDDVADPVCQSHGLRKDDRNQTCRKQYCAIASRTASSSPTGVAQRISTPGCSRPALFDRIRQILPNMPALPEEHRHDGNRGHSPEQQAQPPQQANPAASIRETPTSRPRRTAQAAQLVARAARTARAQRASRAPCPNSTIPCVAHDALRKNPSNGGQPISARPAPAPDRPAPALPPSTARATYSDCRYARTAY